MKFVRFITVTVTNHKGQKSIAIIFCIQKKILNVIIFGKGCFILYYIWSYFSHELVFNFILNKFNKASTKIWICGNGMTQELLTV
jgi:hypothetical protein